MGWGGRLFEAGRLLNISAFRMGAYSSWALIRGWALIRINTVVIFHRLFDHLVQWITLDITKRRYSEHILPVPWPFVMLIIKACERQ